MVEFLGVERETVLGKVCFSDDGGGVGRLLVAAKGAEWQIAGLEREMMEGAKVVSRVICEVSGLKVLGCGGEGRRGGEEGGGMEVGTEVNADMVHVGAVEEVEGNGLQEDTQQHDLQEDGETGNELAISCGFAEGEGETQGEAEGNEADHDVPLMSVSAGEGETEAEVDR